MLENAGKQVEADTVEDNDVVYGRALELADGQPKEGGIEAAQALILPRFAKSEAEKAKLIGAKLGDTITFEPFALYDGQASEIASLLQIEKEAVPALDGVAFSYQITKISRREAAELNDAFFTEASAKVATSVAKKLCVRTSRRASLSSSPPRATSSSRVTCVLSFSRRQAR